MAGHKTDIYTKNVLFSPKPGIMKRKMPKILKTWIESYSENKKTG